MATLFIQSSEPPAPPEWVLKEQADLHFAWKPVALLASAPLPDLEAPFWIVVMSDRGPFAPPVKSVDFSSRHWMTGLQRRRGLQQC